MALLTDPRPSTTDVGTDAVATVRHERLRRGVRGKAVSVVLALLLLVVVCVSLSVGDFNLPLPDVVRALTGNGSRSATFVVTELRLPRVLTGVLVGIAFGLSGAIFQTLIRNPLASPDIIGITSGASFGAVVCIILLGLSGVAVSGGAFVGALVTAALIYVLAWKNGVHGYRLVLVGIGMAAILSSAISYLMVRAELYTAQEALVWLTGSLNGGSWSTVLTLAWCSAVLVPLGLVLGRPLRMLQLGDDPASSLGVMIERSRLALIIVGVALASVATAAGGPIGFVAFVSAPIARRLTGHTSLALVPAALVGALVVTVSDFAAQHATGVQFPVGVVTGIVGAPYLLWLLMHTNRGGRGG
jgi:iron complex transport system permease protein